MHITDHNRTIQIQIGFENGDWNCRFVIVEPKNISVIFFLAKYTNKAGITYWIVAPAYEPTTPTKISKFSVTKASKNGGTTAISGNNILWIKKSLVQKADSVDKVSFDKNSVFRFIVKVTAMIGKLVLRVKTGKRGKK